MNKQELQEFLDYKVQQYNTPAFIKDDPIGIPHLFQQKEDIEIAGFLTAIIAWGRRSSIINNAHKLMDLMEHQPYRFIMEEEHWPDSDEYTFVHRTFNTDDIKCFHKALKVIYQKHGGLEKVLCSSPSHLDKTIANFKQLFFEVSPSRRTGKHIANPLEGSAAKRILMYLRWMVRKDKNGVDFGLWNKMDAKHLYCPLDVHSGNVARKLKLLNRKQNDWRAVTELTQNLRKFDPNDPIKYDFALFGLGVYEGF